MHEQVIHVRYSAAGSWVVQPDDLAPISQHPTATAAERAAIAYVADVEDVDVVVHDRYARVHSVHGHRARPSAGRTRKPQPQGDRQQPAGQAARRSPR